MCSVSQHFAHALAKLLEAWDQGRLDARLPALKPKEGFPGGMQQGNGLTHLLLSSLFHGASCVGGSLMEEGGQAVSVVADLHHEA